MQLHKAADGLGPCLELAEKKRLRAMPVGRGEPHPAGQMHQLVTVRRRQEKVRRIASQHAQRVDQAAQKIVPSARSAYSRGARIPARRSDSIAFESRGVRN